MSQLLDNGQLVGLARIEDVLSTADDIVMSELMDDDPPTVTSDVDPERPGGRPSTTVRARSPWSMQSGPRPRP